MGDVAWEYPNSGNRGSSGCLVTESENGEVMCSNLYRTFCCDSSGNRLVISNDVDVGIHTCGDPACVCCYLLNVSVDQRLEPNENQGVEEALMSMSNDQLKDWFKDEFTDIKLRISVCEDKSNEILRRLDVVSHETNEMHKTLYGKGALVEQFTVLHHEHCSHMACLSPELKVARKKLSVDRIAIIIAVLTSIIALARDLIF